MKLLEKIKSWCAGRDSLLVKILPTGLAMAMMWDRFETVRAGQYAVFAGFSAMMTFLALLLIGLPNTLLGERNEKNKQTGKWMYNNANVLFGEILIFAGIIIYIVD